MGRGLDTGATSVVQWKAWPDVVYRRQVGAEIIPQWLTAVNRCFHLENILLPGGILGKNPI